MSHFHNNALIGASGQGGGYNLESSLRLRGDASAYLSRTPTTAGNQKTWTWSGWIKRARLGGQGYLFGSINGGTNSYLYFQSSDKLQFIHYPGTVDALYRTSRVFRDPSAWYHIVLAVDTTQATATDRIKLWVNGEDTIDDYNNTIDLNTDTYVNGTYQHILGFSSTVTHDGYLTEVNFVDGQALAPSDFGETDDTTGVWKPKEYTGTYGTNGFYLDFSEKIPAYNIQAYGNTQHDTAQSKIGGSSIYYDGSGDYLDLDTNNLKMLDSIGTGDFTIEFWIRYASVNSYQWFIGGDTSNMFDIIQIPSNLRMILAGTEYTFSHSPSTNTWYHYAVSRNNGSLRAFVNGTQIGTTQSSSDNINGQSLISGKQFNDQYQFNGWLDEIRLSNSARYTSNFTAPTTAFTADSNTILLIHSDTTDGSTTFTDSSGIGTGSGTDQSGNGNNFIPNNINTTNSTSTTYDLMNDVPTLTDEDTANFATWNPLTKTDTSFTLTNANLTLSGSDAGKFATILASSGKFYCELYVNGTSGAGNGPYIRVMNDYVADGSTISYANYSSNGVGINKVGGSFPINGAWGSAWSAGNTVGVAFDLDNNTVTFYLNNTSQGTMNIDANVKYGVFYFDNGSNGNSINFGQRPFKYTPPTGYKKLNTYNLPDSNIVDGSQYMNPVTYTGTGVDDREVTVGFAPDFTWIKRRDTSADHMLFDTIRGAGYNIFSNRGVAERYQDTGGYLSAFTSDGFQVHAGSTSDASVNGSGNTYVAWNWRGSDSAAVTNTDGSITSTVSANPTSGFSVVTYTGNGTNSTVGHGLGVAPNVMLFKNRTTGDNWQVYHQTLGATQFVRLNATNAAAASSTVLNDTAPTSSVFTVGTLDATNESGENIVAYCFADVEGFSKFGSYTGNGSTDGPFVYTGFRPVWIMIKRSDSATPWYMWDSSRNTYNITNLQLYANLSNAEATENNIDLVSNGFKWRNSISDGNASGGTFIYMAFAENPFKNSLAR